MASKQQSVGGWQGGVGSRQQAAGSDEGLGISRQQAAGSRQWPGSRNLEISKSQNPSVPLRGENTRRRAFTLVELLVAMTIIAILAAMVAGAVGMARHQVRADKTQYLIDKLNTIIMTKYDTYRTRRVPLDLRQYVWAHSKLNANCPTELCYYHLDYVPGDPSTIKWPREIARARVNAIRDLIRLEMPDRWSDVIHGPLVLRTPNGDLTGDPVDTPIWPSLTKRYYRIYKNSKAYADGNTKYGAAECLYMIVMAIPGAAEQFQEHEIGDADHDGLPEFVDAWGEPIRFLRWPSGFYHDPDDNLYAVSDLQFGPADLLSGKNPKYQSDPFDPTSVLAAQGSFALFPLIYSAGPDGQFDINIGKVGGSTTDAYQLYNGDLDPFRADENNHPIGQPYNNDGKDDDPNSFFRDLRHHDNIHNHRRVK